MIYNSILFLSLNVYVMYLFLQGTYEFIKQAKWYALFK